MAATATLPLASDAVPSLWVSLTRGAAQPFLVIAPALGLLSLGALYRRRHRIAAAAAVGQTAAILLGWGVASYPYLVFPTVTLAGAAAAPQAQLAILIGAVAGLVVLVPSLWLLFTLFKGKMPGMAPSPKPSRPRR